MSAVDTANRANSLCMEYASPLSWEKVSSYAANADLALLVALSFLPEDKHGAFLDALAHEFKLAEEAERNRLIAKGIAQEVAA